VQYEANMSYVLEDSSRMVSVESPVVVINSGTPEYGRMGMDELVSSINIMSLVNKFIPNLDGPVDPVRGNIQKFFGIAGCQNVGVAVSEELIVKHYGVTMPRVLEGSEDVNVCHALRVGWKIGKLAQIIFCQPFFLVGNHFYCRYFDYITQRLGGEEYMWASVALCCLPLKKGSKVFPHHDRENDLVCTATLNVSWIKCLDGKWYRFSLVYYMRKSIHDMLVR
jgi:hypothetical protein